MKTKNISIDYKILDISELDDNGKRLIADAICQAKKAYAPYSNFYVGAAVLMDNGEVITGCNQENASYPLACCAERVALFSAHSKFPNVAIKRLAIVAINPAKSLESPISPCGACRQVILESEIRSKGNINLIMKGESDQVYMFESIKSLLPLSFDSRSL